MLLNHNVQQLNPSRITHHLVAINETTSVKALVGAYSTVKRAHLLCSPANPAFIVMLHCAEHEQQ